MPVSSIMLFSETINSKNRSGDRIKVAAANKILRLLEWIDERDALEQGT